MNKSKKKLGKKVIVKKSGNGMTGFDLMTTDSYFTILVGVIMNNILAENIYFMNHIEWTEHKIMVLKPANTLRGLINGEDT